MCIRDSDEAVVEVPDSSELAVEVDAQVMQLTLKASHPQSLPHEVASNKDVRDLFGRVTMQACRDLSRDRIEI